MSTPVSVPTGGAWLILSICFDLWPTWFGMRFRYAAQGGPILVSATNGDGAVSIMVSDNGPGVPESELEEIFKPFYRPEFARQRQTGGVGLGLAIVKSCVQACGGTVVGRNRSPNGLEVEIRLPAANN